MYCKKKYDFYFLGKPILQAPCFANHMPEQIVKLKERHDQYRTLIVTDEKGRRSDWNPRGTNLDKLLGLNTHRHN